MSLYPKLSESALALSSDEELEGWRQNKSPKLQGSSPVRSNGFSAVKRHTPRAERYSPTAGRGTVSLPEFERQYSRRSLPSARGNAREKVDTPKWFSLWRKAKDAVYDIGRTNKFIVVLAGCFLGVVTAAILGELQLGKAQPRDNDLRCPAITTDDTSCIPQDQLLSALDLANRIKAELKKKARLHDCTDDTSFSRNMSVGEIQKVFEVANCTTLHHVFLLVLHNLHWSVSVTDKEGGNISHPSHILNNTDVMQSSHSYKTISCRLLTAFAVVWLYAKLIAIVLLVCGGVVLVGRWYVNHHKREKEAIFTMVEKIVEVLKQHYKNTLRKKDLVPYLAIIHVRDMLIPPSERLRKQAVWERAVDWIARHESRVRVEEGRIAGEDFTVWRWIQSDPPPTEEPRKNERDSFWQGKVFEEYPPGMDSRIAPPAGQPSPCIRLKNMFDSASYMKEEQVKEIENCILDRCAPHGGVVHILVDRMSTYGCVYLKMDSIPSASKAYSSLHGSWFKGKLVTAKYIPVEKYHKWFPQASTSKTFHYPS